MAVLRDWLITFGMIIAKPLPQTFLVESEKAKGKFSSAVAWLAFVVASIHIYTFLAFKKWLQPFTIVASFLLLPIVFLFFVFCVHMLYQRLFRGKKDYYAELLYLIVGIFVPFIIANLFVAPISGILGEILFWVTLVYPSILMVIAVKTVTKLKIWQSILTVFLSLVLASVGYFCIPAFILGIMNAVPRVF